MLPRWRCDAYEAASVPELSVRLIQSLKGLASLIAWILVRMHQHRQSPAGVGAV